jgi:hypothetical protein
MRASRGSAHAQHAGLHARVQPGIQLGAAQVPVRRRLVLAGLLGRGRPAQERLLLFLVVLRAAAGAVAVAAHPSTTRPAARTPPLKRLSEFCATIILACPCIACQHHTKAAEGPVS